MGTEEIRKDANIRNWQSELAYDQWLALPVPGSRPSARYKHAAAVVDEKLYVSGGSRNGRYLSDVQVFDFENLEWSTIKLKPNAVKLEESDSQDVLSPISSHNMIKWENKLLLLGGHSKKLSGEVIVWFIDLETHRCGIMETLGKVPVARGGQSTTLVGSRLIMFGGEDGSRRLLNDVSVLDLETMTWDVAETMQTPPAPRFDHTAAVHAERYLLIFGGCSHASFFNDLHVLDLQSMEWSQPQTLGDLVASRAGHAGITINENWYIVGGGDNRNGCPETLVLDMSKLVWSVLTSVKQRDPLASEGVSVCSVLIEGQKHLVAFGGYNGKYSNEVFVLRPKPTDLSRPKILQSPAAAAAAASVTAAYALSKKGKLESVDVESKSTGVVSTKDVEIEIEAIKEEKNVLELSLAEVEAENSKLKGATEEVNGTHAELGKELRSVQGQLVAERSRCFKLEAQITELHKMLESMQAIEDEVQVLRRQKSAFERDIELASAAQKQGSGGVWRWIAGGNA
ncbi:Acyl-CoA-binding domain-containing protein 4 [Morus notabilis]|uniref:Acyl-CoA-binding domain-containing protein 4 n=1 Tax=Morus notabilis TaxID=981085 RepID=W9QKP3_9ROSA|nr:acyl-CoA-binding domain-containing protein 4 [Morus notabilis]XP_024017434.1 acyl-CoA-binding domain-containing protein 4 [Morus notabilis]XP_024017435.1 acyl-CoA-binding domain-containing protein 4 [Morus notabilis]EXB39449.1 Acyl-CoA-binding domain-containing protein 4 [Morus notabilis]